MTTADWISLANVVATTVAIGVALWLGVGASRKAQRDAVAKATLVAARFSVALKTAGAISEEFSDLLAFDDLTIKPSDAQAIRSAQDGTLNDALSVVAADVFEADIDTLAALTALPNHCAHRIARASGLLADVKKQIKAVFPGAEWDGYGTADRQKLLTGWGASISEASRLLRAAQAVCEQAAATGAPHPTGDEIWGP